MEVIYQAVPVLNKREKIIHIKQLTRQTINELNSEINKEGINFQMRGEHHQIMEIIYRDKK